MAIRVYKPVTNGRRNASVNLHEEVTHTGRPEKSLVTALPEYGLGRILANNLSPTPLYPIFYAAIRTKMRRSTEALKGMLSPAGS